MTTPLSKPVKRVTVGNHRGRRIVIALLPGDIIELRQERLRTSETLTIGGAFDYAVMTRISREKFEKRKQKGTNHG